MRPTILSMPAASGAFWCWWTPSSRNSAPDLSARTARCISFGEVSTWRSRGFPDSRAPKREGADSITREAYSHEVISAGFWPGGGEIKGAAFYAYAAPEPAGYAQAAVRPSKAFYHPQMKEFFLMYDDVRLDPSPRSALLDFLQSTYEAGANLAKWDRAELERTA